MLNQQVNSLSGRVDSYKMINGKDDDNSDLVLEPVDTGKYFSNGLVNSQDRKQCFSF